MLLLDVQNIHTLFCMLFSIHLHILFLPYWIYFSCLVCSEMLFLLWLPIVHSLEGLVFGYLLQFCSDICSWYIDTVLFYYYWVHIVLANQLMSLIDKVILLVSFLRYVPVGLVVLQVLVYILVLSQVHLIVFSKVKFSEFWLLCCLVWLAQQLVFV